MEKMNTLFLIRVAKRKQKHNYRLSVHVGAGYTFLTRASVDRPSVVNAQDILYNYSFDKGRIKSLVSWSLKNYGEFKTINLLENLKKTGFEYATKAGISLGIEDLKIPTKKKRLLYEAEEISKKANDQYNRAEITGVERFQRLIDTWHRTSEQLKNEVIDCFESTDVLNPVYMMAFSGARGNISQVRQLVGMRGLMADPKGQIIDYPIRSNFREGLTLTEYIISCYGARKGIVDTALRTANAGYLTRRLVDVAQHVVISTFDCGTYKGIFLSDMKEGNKTIYSLQTRLIGRVLARDLFVNKRRHVPASSSGNVSQLFPKDPGSFQKLASRNQEISSDLAFEITKHFKKVFVRSPLTCNTGGAGKKLICQLCYGWSLAQGKLVSIGEAVGIVAAQSIGEPGTQLTMRTFHTGGVFSGDISDQIRAPYNGFVHYFDKIPGTLIRTPEGKMAFLTKTDGLACVYNNLTDISKAKQYKIPAYTILYYKNNEAVVEKQVIAQISTIAHQQTMREDSELTVKTQLQGQFFVQNLQIKEKLIGPKPKKQDLDQNNRATPTLLMTKTMASWDWGYAWVLSCQFQKIPIFSHTQDLSLVPQKGDFVDTKSIMAQIQWVLPQHGGQFTYFANTLNSFYNFKSKHSNLSFKRSLNAAYDSLDSENRYFKKGLIPEIGYSFAALSQNYRQSWINQNAYNYNVGYLQKSNLKTPNHVVRSIDIKKNLLFLDIKKITYRKIGYFLDNLKYLLFLPTNLKGQTNYNGIGYTTTWCNHTIGDRKPLEVNSNTKSQTESLSATRTAFSMDYKPIKSNFFGVRVFPKNNFLTALEENQGSYGSCQLGWSSEFSGAENKGLRLYVGGALNTLLIGLRPSEENKPMAAFIDQNPTSFETGSKAALGCLDTKKTKELLFKIPFMFFKPNFPSSKTKPQIILCLKTKSGHPSLDQATGMGLSKQLSGQTTKKAIESILGRKDAKKRSFIEKGLLKDKRNYKWVGGLQQNVLAAVSRQNNNLGSVYSKAINITWLSKEYTYRHVKNMYNSTTKKQKVGNYFLFLNKKKGSQIEDKTKTANIMQKESLGARSAYLQKPLFSPLRVGGALTHTGQVLCAERLGFVYKKGYTGFLTQNTDKRVTNFNYLQPNIVLNKLTVQSQQNKLFPEQILPKSTKQKGNFIVDRRDGAKQTSGSIGLSPIDSYQSSTLIKLFENQFYLLPSFKTLFCPVIESPDKRRAQPFSNLFEGFSAKDFCNLNQTWFGFKAQYRFVTKQQTDSQATKKNWAIAEKRTKLLSLGADRKIEKTEIYPSFMCKLKHRIAKFFDYVGNRRLQVKLKSKADWAAYGCLFNLKKLMFKPKAPATHDNRFTEDNRPQKAAFISNGAIGLRPSFGFEKKAIGLRPSLDVTKTPESKAYIYLLCFSLKSSVSGALALNDGSAFKKLPYFNKKEIYKTALSSNMLKGYAHPLRGITSIDSSTQAIPGAVSTNTPIWIYKTFYGFNQPLNITNQQSWPVFFFDKKILKKGVSTCAKALDRENILFLDFETKDFRVADRSKNSVSVGRTPFLFDNLLIYSSCFSITSCLADYIYALRANWSDLGGPEFLCTRSAKNSSLDYRQPTAILTKSNNTESTNKSLIKAAVGCLEWIENRVIRINMHYDTTPTRSVGGVGGAPDKPHKTKKDSDKSSLSTLDGTYVDSRRLPTYGLKWYINPKPRFLPNEFVKKESKKQIGDELSPSSKKAGIDFKEQKIKKLSETVVYLSFQKINKYNLNNSKSTLGVFNIKGFALNSLNTKLEPVRRDGLTESYGDLSTNSKVRGAYMHIPKASIMHGVHTNLGTHFVQSKPVLPTTAPLTVNKNKQILKKIACFAYQGSFMQSFKVMGRVNTIQLPKGGLYVRIENTKHLERKQHLVGSLHKSAPSNIRSLINQVNVTAIKSNTLSLGSSKGMRLKALKGQLDWFFALSNIKSSSVFYGRGSIIKAAVGYQSKKKKINLGGQKQPKTIYLFYKVNKVGSRRLITLSLDNSKTKPYSFNKQTSSLNPLSKIPNASLLFLGSSRLTSFSTAAQHKNYVKNINALTKKNPIHVAQKQILGKDTNSSIEAPLSLTQPISDKISNVLNRRLDLMSKKMRVGDGGALALVPNVFKQSLNTNKTLNSCPFIITYSIPSLFDYQFQTINLNLTHMYSSNLLLSSSSKAYIGKNVRSAIYNFLLKNMLFKSVYSKAINIKRSNKTKCYAHLLGTQEYTQSMDLLTQVKATHGPRADYITKKQVGKSLAQTLKTAKTKTNLLRLVSRQSFQQISILQIVGYLKQVCFELNLRLNFRNYKHGLLDSASWGEAPRGGLETSMPQTYNIIGQQKESFLLNNNKKLPRSDMHGANSTNKQQIKMRGGGALALSFINDLQNPPTIQTTFKVTHSANFENISCSLNSLAKTSFFSSYTGEILGITAKSYDQQPFYKTEVTSRVELSQQPKFDLFNLQKLYNPVSYIQKQKIHNNKHRCLLLTQKDLLTYSLFKQDRKTEFRAVIGASSKEKTKIDSLGGLWTPRKKQKSWTGTLKQSAKDLYRQPTEALLIGNLNLVKIGSFVVRGSSVTQPTAALIQKEQIKTAYGFEKQSLDRQPTAALSQVFTIPGQIIHLNRQKVTIRKAQPIFISAKSTFHAFPGDFVEKNQEIITLIYQQIKTGDIVQGIPKVEQFFEARTTKRGRLFRDNLPNLLKGLFLKYYVYSLKCMPYSRDSFNLRAKATPTLPFKQSLTESSLKATPIGNRRNIDYLAKIDSYSQPTAALHLALEWAVKQSFYKIQQIAVDGVLRVYRSQGVTISDKHLEIIVKQMTTKVRIIKGGQTGFFPGELVDFDFVETINSILIGGAGKKIHYEPVILGITKASLQVDSFLSSASFQQTARILSQSALYNKKDFLKGVKENVILGNLIPAGTGYLVSLDS
jgi:RNA polymerase Rpb1, domain 5/RNA polymerase Rpb1, domain 4